MPLRRGADTGGADLKDGGAGPPKATVGRGPVPPAVAVVHAWHHALNRADASTVLELSDRDIEIVGPRGTGRGRALLLQWLEHARVQMHPLSTYRSDDSVVVLERAVWLSPETGDLIDEREVASTFRVTGGTVSRYSRHDTLQEALAFAGLEESDRI